MKLAEKAINREFCDIVIVDLKRDDYWPNLIFTRFDEAAASFPIIILCGRICETLRFAKQARHVTNFVTEEMIESSLFPSLIEAALLRGEIQRDNKSIEEPGNN
jgi:hypothetical protein